MKTRGTARSSEGEKPNRTCQEERVGRNIRDMPLGQ